MVDMSIQIRYNKLVTVERHFHCLYIWSHGQVVKTPPFHGGNRGSSPLGTTTKESQRLSFFAFKYPPLVVLCCRALGTTNFNLSNSAEIFSFC